jgi:hypothetical protein
MCVYYMDKNGLLYYILRYGLSSYDASGIFYLCKSQSVLEFLNNLWGLGAE